MVQYYILDFLILCFDNEEWKSKSNGIWQEEEYVRSAAIFTSHFFALLHHPHHYLYCQWKNHEKVPSVYVVLDILEVSDLFYPYTRHFFTLLSCVILFLLSKLAILTENAIIVVIYLMDFNQALSLSTDRR